MFYTRIDPQYAKSTTQYLHLCMLAEARNLQLHPYHSAHKVGNPMRGQYPHICNTSIVQGELL